MNTHAEKFIDSIANSVIKKCTGTSLYPSVMIAQACLESNFGRSKLSSLHFNFFGIKANASCKGDTITYNTTEFINGKSTQIKQVFRSYPSLELGFADRIAFLQSNPRYSKNGVFTSTSPTAQAEAFLRAGYATDPRYAQKLITIIQQYNLTKFDK